MPKIKFYKEKQEIEVPAGTNLREAALAAGIGIYPGINKTLNCLGHGTCGSCRVQIMNGTLKNASPMSFLERLRFKLSYLNIGDDELRLACQTKVMGDLEVYTQPLFNWVGKPDKQPIPTP